MRSQAARDCAGRRASNFAAPDVSRSGACFFSSLEIRGSWTRYCLLIHAKPGFGALLKKMRFSTGRLLTRHAWLIRDGRAAR